MPTVLHPRALESVRGQPPAAVSHAGDNYDVDANGRVSLPNDSAVRSLAQAYDVTPKQLAPEFEDNPTCAGNDGQCSRSVESAGEYCWQHSE
jgi:hypothetical protein